MPCVAYVLRRFPVLSNTFVTAEILALRETGVRVPVFSLLSPHSDVVSERSRKAAGEDTGYAPFASPEVLAALAAEARRSPATLAEALRIVVDECAAQDGTMARALTLFPKAVYFGRRARQYSVTHVHSHWAGLPTTMARIVATVCGAPFSFTVHTMAEIEQTPHLARQVSASSGVRVNSRANAARLVGVVPQADGKVCFARAMSTVPLSQGPPTPSIFSQTPRRFVAIGRLVPMKGFDDLVQACSLLYRQGIDFHATIIGDGPQREELEAIAASEGLPETCLMFAGARPHEQTIELLRHAAFLVAPSVRVVDNGGHHTEDGLPQVLIEAMACGVPAISTALGGIGEIVHDGRTGLIVPQRDPAALATAIRRLIEGPAWTRALGLAAQKLIKAEYSVERTLSSLCKLYGIASHPAVAEGTPWVPGPLKKSGQEAAPV